MIKAISDLSDAEIYGQTILMRVDFNCPLDAGKIADSTRIDRVLPGLLALREKGVVLILISHLGRPKGKPVPDMSLAPICAYISEKTGDKLSLISQIDGLRPMQAGQWVMLENLRFWPEEEANDPEFASQLAAAGNIYVNDAFSCAHRAHASTDALARLLPAFAGPTLMQEVKALQAALDFPERPVVAVVGGAKISTKLDVLSHLTQKVDDLILGGGMANTFLAAKGIDMGKSLLESDLIDIAKQIMEKAEKNGCQIHLPCDGVAVTQFAAHADHDIVRNSDIGQDQMIVDIGPQSISQYSAIIDKARTVLWNGPMGAFELQPFDRGTVELAKKVAECSKKTGMTSVAGGGDTVAALNHAGCSADFTYVSLAGGAFLEWIEGRVLPGIEILQTNR